MKIEMNVRMTRSGKTFLEEYVIDDNLDPEKYAQDMLDRFNSTIRGGESTRELVDVKIIGEDKLKSKHTWVKQNIVTIMGRNGVYDIMKCDKCGITARRYGFESVQIDRKYSAKIYNTCESAINQLKKLEDRRKYKVKN